VLRRSTPALRRTLAAGGVLAAAGALTLAVTGSSTATGQACPATVQVPEKSLPRFFPPLASGDREFNGNGPAITVSAKRKLIDSSPRDFLVVTVKMKAEETRSDWTAGRGERTFTLYESPTGCNISIFVPLGSFDSNGYLARARLSNPHALDPGNTGINGSFVRRYTVWDDRAGKDVGEYTSVQVLTRAFTVRLEG
jgi:hypothetical protein